MLNEDITDNVNSRQNVLCPFCGEDVAPYLHYCPCCGKDLSGCSDFQKASSFSDPDVTLSSCISCGAPIPFFARFCSECGQDQRAKARPVNRVSPVFPAPSPVQNDQDETVAMQQRLLEVVYIKQHGCEVSSEAADKLFPFGWYDYCSMKHIEALADAIEKNILLRETKIWNRELQEGIR